MKIIYYKKDESRIFYDSHFNFVGSGSSAWRWTPASKKHPATFGDGVFLYRGGENARFYKKGPVLMRLRIQLSHT